MEPNDVMARAIESGRKSDRHCGGREIEDLLGRIFHSEADQDMFLSIMSKLLDTFLEIRKISPLKGFEVSFRAIDKMLRRCVEPSSNMSKKRTSHTGISRKDANHVRARHSWRCQCKYLFTDSVSNYRLQISLQQDISHRFRVACRQTYPTSYCTREARSG
ncbi:hypothetical protein BJ508DRAFT_117996 [Ascobolus immersus RN42]|uniref:Uncharacterized protein n=1 Tax=Ascobolus immersus RN42 TaxID=1160509 RepID=A0A3N4I8N1_ASCIM|nr:hypothetical protein BJ508DRAFT_117996 [Ascobolus immersus RN42]